jgi:hypothetical protein
MFSSTFSLLLLALVSSAADAAPQNTNGDTLNATIPAYTDSILSAVAASPPTNASAANVQFSNGPRTLGGAYVHFTERDGTDGNGHVGVVLELSVPHNLSSTNNVFSWAGACALHQMSCEANSGVGSARERDCAGRQRVHVRRGALGSVRREQLGGVPPDAREPLDVRCGRPVGQVGLAQHV